MNAPQHLHAINAADLCVRLDQVFATALCEKRIVGAIAIVAQHGQVLYRRAHGLADRESARPLQEDNLFRLASVTKPIVTVAVLRLIASGHMRLDDPITRWLPDFTPKLADGSAPVLTVHQLLSHTAGLSYVLSEEFGTCYHTLGISDGLDLVDFDLQENLRRLAAAPLLYAPGSAWRYSLSPVARRVGRRHRARDWPIAGTSGRTTGHRAAGHVRHRLPLCQCQSGTPAHERQP